MPYPLPPAPAVHENMALALALLNASDIFSAFRRPTAFCLWHVAQNAQRCAFADGEAKVYEDTAKGFLCPNKLLMLCSTPTMAFLAACNLPAMSRIRLLMRSAPNCAKVAGSPLNQFRADLNLAWMRDPTKHRANPIPVAVNQAGDVGHNNRTQHEPAKRRGQHDGAQPQ